MSKGKTQLIQDCAEAASNISRLLTAFLEVLEERKAEILEFLLGVSLAIAREENRLHHVVTGPERLAVIRRLTDLRRALQNRIEELRDEDYFVPSVDPVIPELLDEPAAKPTSGGA